jgi:hypothetical protein
MTALRQVRDRFGTLVTIGDHPEPIALVERRLLVESAISMPIPAAWACGKCKTICQTEDAARACCAERYCACGKPLMPGFSNLECRDCTDAQWQAAARKRREDHLANATAVPEQDYTGPVYVEAYEEFYSSMDDFRDAFWADHDSDEAFEPGPVFACTCFGYHLDAEHAVEQALEEHHEDAFDHIGDAAVSELQVLMDQWAQKHPVTSWAIDYSRMIVPDPDYHYVAADEAPDDTKDGA